MRYKVNDDEALLDTVRQLCLPVGEYAIFGSGPLWVRGIIDACNDIDVICRAAAWSKVQELGELKYLPGYDVEIVSMLEGKITFGTSWGIGDANVDELVRSAQTIAGLPFVRLEAVENYKRIRNSEKDRQHLAALADWRATGNSQTGGRQ